MGTVHVYNPRGCGGKVLIAGSVFMHSGSSSVCDPLSLMGFGQPLLVVMVTTVPLVVASCVQL